jgi:hypothetical protein
MFESLSCLFLEDKTLFKIGIEIGTVVILKKAAKFY